MVDHDQVHKHVDPNTRTISHNLVEKWLESVENPLEAEVLLDLVESVYELALIGAEKKVSKRVKIAISVNSR